MSDRTDPDIELLQEVPTRLADIREFERELVAAAEMAEGEDGPPAPDEGGGEEELEAQPPDPADWLDEDEVPTAFIQLPHHGYHGEPVHKTVVDEVGLAGHGDAGDAAHLTARDERRAYERDAGATAADDDLGYEERGYEEDAVAAAADDQVWIAGDTPPVTAVDDVGGRPTAPVPVATVLTGESQPSFHKWLALFVVLGVIGAINAGLLLGLHMNDEADSVPPPGAVASAPTNEAEEPAIEADAPAQPAPEASAPAAAMPGAAAPAPDESAEAPAAPTAVAEDATEVEIDPVVVEPEEDHLLVAQRAIEAADREAAATALERAREAGAEPAERDRLRAQLMVLRGDGATAVSELRAMTSAYADDAVIWLALARVLAQAENDDAAEQAFERVLELDEHSVDAHVGIARLATRAAHLRTARRHLAAAREAYEQGEPNPVLEARLHVTEGIIDFELGRYAEATSLAERALALDEKSAEAHLLLGRIAIEQDRNGDAAEHLRAAVEGRAPPAEALGMLVPRTDGNVCELAERYLAIAPSGYDARTVRQARDRCR